MFTVIHKQHLALSILIICSMLLPGCGTSSRQEKTAVFIIGMGRSGSSCAAGVLHILGMELGSPLAPANSGNEKGKFEHQPTIDFMQPILREFDTIWPNQRLIDWKTVPNREELKNRVQEHLQTYFGDYPFFGIKNPEITPLLPLFIDAAKELGYTPKLIMVLRHPDETNASLQRALGTPNTDYYQNISIALTCAFRNAQDIPLHTVYFDDLISRPQETIQDLRKFLPQLKEYTQVKQAISQFIDGNLKHHNAKS